MTDFEPNLLYALEPDGDFVAIWSGEYPCLCCGRWTLKCGEQDISYLIPEDKVNEPMNTHKEYDKWYFDNNYSEQWTTHINGLQFNDWLKENEWVYKVSHDTNRLHELYNTFQDNDFCHGSCGGCI